MAEERIDRCMIDKDEEERSLEKKEKKKERANPVI
jgi:hypothetical protein